MVAVDKQPYSEIFASDSKLSAKFGRYHYTFALMACLESVKRWRNRFALGKPLRYVFDQMSKGKGEILDIFDARRRKENAYGIIEGGYSFEDKKKVMPLQAADILAWHTYRHMCDKVLRRLPRRAAMNQITKMSLKDGMYDREGLLGISQAFKENPKVFKDI